MEEAKGKDLKNEIGYGYWTSKGVKPTVKIFIDSYESNKNASS